MEGRRFGTWEGAGMGIEIITAGFLVIGAKS